MKWIIAYLGKNKEGDLKRLRRRNRGAWESAESGRLHKENLSCNAGAMDRLVTKYVEQPGKKNNEQNNHAIPKFEHNGEVWRRVPWKAIFYETHPHPQLWRFSIFAGYASIHR